MSKDSVDLIQELMDRRNLKRSDIFSSKARASEIMSRKRPLTIELIRKLHFRFGLPAKVLISPYRSVEEVSQPSTTPKPRTDWHYDRDGYCDNPGRGY